MTLTEKAQAAFYKAQTKFQEIRNKQMESEVEDQYLFQREKGQVLKRASTPRDEEESASLGYFDAETGLTGAALKSIEYDINWLCGLGDDFSLGHFVDLFFRSTGSRKARRLELSLGTVKDIHPDINMGMSSYRGPPEFFGDNPPSQEKEFKR